MKYYTKFPALKTQVKNCWLNTNYFTYVVFILSICHKSKCEQAI